MIYQFRNPETFEVSKFKPQVILTQGVSNCGKTTSTNKFLKNNPNFVNLNRDDMRIALFCKGDSSLYPKYRFKRDKEVMVTKAIEAIAEEAIARGKGVVISDTNLNDKTLTKWESFAKRWDKTLTLVQFDVPLHVCLKRNQQRAITLPEQAIKDQYRVMRKILCKPHYERDSSKPKAIIFDVDGTLACMKDVRTPFEWDKVHLDNPRTTVINLAHMYKANGYKIIVLTGRDGVAYTSTKYWLHVHDVPFDDLFIRDVGDSRPDAEIKEEIFWRDVAPNYDVELAVDDRNQMVDAWRSIGVQCFQVQEGAF